MLAITVEEASMKSKKIGSIKKKLSLLLAAVLAIALMACGSEETKETEGTDGYVYVPQFQTLETGEETHINNVKIHNEKLYYLSYTYDRRNM